MEKLFKEYGELMAKAREVLNKLWHEQEKEIAAVNAEYENMDAVLSVTVAKHGDVLSGDINQIKECKALMYDVDVILAKWGVDLAERDRRIDEINDKYEQMYQKTMKDAGYDLNAGTD